MPNNKRSNQEHLIDLLGMIADLPYAYLPSRAQYNFRVGVKSFLAGLERELGDGLMPSRIGQKAKEAQNFFVSRDFDELNFALALKELFDAGQGVRTWRMNDLMAILERVIKRGQEQAAADRSASAKSLALSPEQVSRQDRETIIQMQFYALDYFLYSYKQLKEADKRRKTAIIKMKTGDMPALLDDILDDDMLRKIVYLIIDSKRRELMIKDYYCLKTAFLPLKREDAPVISGFRVEKALKVYCYGLLDVCLEYDLDKLSQGFHYPYGEGARCAEVKNRL